MKRINTGFTIVELVVVIALLGILAAMAGPSFSQSLELSRLQYSQQIVETTLGQAFSSARSHPDTIIVHGWADSRSFEILTNADVIQQDPCKTENETCRLLDRGILFQEDFSITFTPPYGDIEPREGETHILLKSKSHTVQFTIYHTSGLIDSFIDESE